MRSILAAMTLAVCVLCVPANAEARVRPKPNSTETLLRRLVLQNEKLARQNEQFARELAVITKKLNPNAVVAAADPQEPVRLGNPLLRAPMPLPSDKGLAGYEKHIARSAKLSDLTSGLRVKVAEILNACPGVKVVSGFRRGARVAGSGRPSLHSLYPSQAADLVGNPPCIYAHLQKWPGGYSIDYAAVKHVHVSLSSSGRERGARFVHYGRSRRYASRHQHTGPRRYAMRQDRPVVLEQHAVAR